MLTPSVEVQVESVDELFSLDEVSIVTMLDKKRVSHPADFLTAVSSSVCFYWMFDVAFSKHLNKTLSFLAGHICAD